MSRKVDIFSDSFSRLRISGLTRDPTPEDMTLALSKLESTMSSLRTRGFDIGYNFEDEPNPQSETGIDDRYKDFVAAHLAVRMIPDFGSSLNENSVQQLKREASQLYSSASSYLANARSREVNYPNRQPRGHGNTLRYDQYDRFYSQTSPGSPGGGSAPGGGCDCDLEDIDGLQAALDAKANQSDLDVLDDRVDTLDSRVSTLTGSTLTGVEDVVSSSENVLTGFTFVETHDVSGQSNNPAELAYDPVLNKVWLYDAVSRTAIRYDVDGTPDGLTFTNTAQIDDGATAIAWHSGTLWLIFGGVDRYIGYDASNGVPTGSNNIIDAGSPISATAGSSGNIITMSLAPGGAVDIYDVGGAQPVIDPLTPIASFVVNAPTGISWDGTHYWIGTAESTRRFRQYTDDFIETGLVFDGEADDERGDQVWIDSDTMWSCSRSTTDDEIYVYDKIVSSGAVLTKEDSNLGWLAEAGAGVTFPSGDTATVASFVDDDTITVTSTGTIPIGTITGTTIRTSDIGDTLQVVRPFPLIIAVRSGA